jgi:hypothetical protein
MIEIKYIATEIFLAISIFSLLTVGVFIKKSFNIIYRLSEVVIILLLAIILSSNLEFKKIFNNSIVVDNFSTFRNH